MASFRGSQNYVWDLSKNPLGKGATSTVYLGRHKKTGEEVAVKVFNSVSAELPIEMQMRESEVMQKFNHENIVKLLSIEEEVPSRCKVIVMEYCTHGSLFNLLDSFENHYGVAEEEFLNLIRQISAGMKHLRDNDVVHRDIKPSNILRSVMPDGRSVYKLTDFGTARELHCDEQFESLCGTDEYLFPDLYERAFFDGRANKQFGVYVDLWSLGVTFYHVATGSLPFMPYRGRKNRKTMHFITAKKEHGVISGVQTKLNGHIEWSHDLPTTCQLSTSLKSLITPLLASMLAQQDRIISFEEFFASVNDITSRVPYHVFWPQAFSLLTIYAEQQADFSQLQQLITDQTEIPVDHQLLLHDGKILKCNSRELVAKVLQTSKDNPIFVFNRLPEYKPFRRPVVGSFPDFPPKTDVNADHMASRKCLSALYSIRNGVQHVMLSNQLMNAAVKIYCNYVNKILSDLELTMSHVVKLCDNAQLYKEQLFSLICIQGTLYAHLANSGLNPRNQDLNSLVDILQIIQQTLKVECTKLCDKMKEELAKAGEILKDLHKGQPMDGDWKPSKGCQPSGRCIEKLDFLCQKMAKIVFAFRQDLTTRQLTSNNEQIHRVDKNKLKELCVTAQTLLDEHCLKRAQSLFEIFKSFYSKGVQIRNTATRLELLLANISDQQARLRDKLKASSEQCFAQMDSCLKDIGPGKGQTGGSTDELESEGGRKKEALIFAEDGSQSTTFNLEEISSLLGENSALMKRFEELKFHDEDDFEHVSQAFWPCSEKQ